METLEYKESQAITLKYIGRTHKEIGEVINVPKATVDEWFKTRGRLRSPYFTWKELMDGKRQENLSGNIILHDKEIMNLVTNMARVYNHYILHGIRKPVTRNGEPVLDKDGEVKYYTIPFVPKFKDFYKAWEIQRIMNGKPTKIKGSVCPFCKRKTMKFL